MIITINRARAESVQHVDFFYFNYLYSTWWNKKSKITGLPVVSFGLFLLNECSKEKVKVESLGTVYTFSLTEKQYTYLQLKFSQYTFDYIITKLVK